MRKVFLSVVIAATALTAMPATAQSTYRQADREYRGRVHHAQRDYRHDVREARQEHRADRRNIRRYRQYDYNRFEPGERHYYADRYYRSGANYRPYRLGRNDRVYRGRSGRYYCRRSDGTTGLIVGGLAGGALGNIIAGGGSRLLGTLVGAGGGALLGQSIDRGKVVCR